MRLKELAKARVAMSLIKVKLLRKAVVALLHRYKRSKN